MSVVSIPDGVAINIASRRDSGENRDTVRHTSARLGELLVVAKDIGPSSSGSRASRIAVDTISSSVEGMPTFFPPAIAVEEAICQANAAITAAAAEPGCTDGPMGATMVVALLHIEADCAHMPVQAVIGRVGNSRAYLVHKQKLELLTRGHTVELDLPGNQVMPQEGQVQDKVRDRVQDKSLSTPHLGMELNMPVHVSQVWLEAGDTLLLCCHDLWGQVPEQEIAQILADEALSVEEASGKLRNLALHAGGQADVAFEVARLPQDSDAATDADRVEPRPEVLPTSSTSQPDWPNSPVTPEKIHSVTGTMPPMREKMLSLVRGLGRLKSDKDAIAEKPTAAPSVSAVQPTVSWATPEPIPFGTGLSSVQLSAVASVQGKFHYTPGPGYVLQAGTHTLWATFLAAGSSEDHPVLAEVSITVLKVTPSVQWPTPADVPAGVALCSAQLNASASIPGTFEYAPAAGEVLRPGTHSLTVTFRPKDNANYMPAQATRSVTVAKTVPAIDWASPEPIVYGTPLCAAQLNASASVPGRFEYSPAAGEILPAGSHTLLVTFIPSDEADYVTARTTILLSVMRSTPAILWPSPEKITYGTVLNDMQLKATASVPGTFLYTPKQGAMLAAGEHTPAVIFTPSNLSDYTPAEAAVPLSVAKANPVITWTAPDPINSGTPLSSAQLNASACIPGTFVYSPAAMGLLEPGVHTLTVTFTPADSMNYTPAQASVSLAVTEIMTAEITWLNPSPIAYGMALSNEQLNAGSAVPGSFLYIPGVGDVLPPGEHKLSVIFTPEDQGRYDKVTAVVSLVVEKLPNVASVLRPALKTPSDSGLVVESAVIATAEPIAARTDHQLTQDPQPKTRTYKGAIYEKGDDDQWHLQRK